jgi:hypothetical protein
MNLVLLYLDPGSGSMIVQALIAGALGFMMFFKNLKYKVARFFSKTKTDTPDDEA